MKDFSKVYRYDDGSELYTLAQIVLVKVTDGFTVEVDTFSNSDGTIIIDGYSDGNRVRVMIDGEIMVDDGLHLEGTIIEIISNINTALVEGDSIIADDWEMLGE